MFMKKTLRPAFVAITLLCFISCKKTIENGGMVGNWK
jgi:hypothetical protein